MLVGGLRAFQLPGKFGHGGAEVMGTLRPAEQEEAGAFELPSGSMCSPFQEGQVIPATDGGFRDPLAILGDENLPGLGEGRGIEVAQAGLLTKRSGPVVAEGLGTDFVLLGKTEGGQTLAIAGEIMPLPSNGNAARSGRDFK